MSDAPYALAPDLLWRRTAREVMVLPVRAPDPLVLEGTSVALWALLEDGPCTGDELVGRLARDFSVGADVVSADLVPVLDRLVVEGVLERRRP